MKGCKKRDIVLIFLTLSALSNLLLLRRLVHGNRRLAVFREKCNYGKIRKPSDIVSSSASSGSSEETILNNFTKINLDDKLGRYDNSRQYRIHDNVVIGHQYVTLSNREGIRQ